MGTLSSPGEELPLTLRTAPPSNPGGVSDETSPAPRSSLDDRSVVGRVFSIIDCVSRAPGETSLAEIRRVTGIPKPTVYRMASDLVRRGILERGRYGYRLGLRLFELGQRVPSQRRLRETAHPFMEDLYEETHETVLLGVLDGVQVLFLERVAGHRSLKEPSALGARIPAYASAMGKAILAFSEPSVVERVIAAGMSSLTPFTVVSPERLREQLEEVHAQGVAYDREEMGAGVTCVAAPILSRTGGEVLASLAVTGPTVRFKPERLVQRIKLAAERISNELSVTTRLSSSTRFVRRT